MTPPCIDLSNYVYHLHQLAIKKAIKPTLLFFLTFSYPPYDCDFLDLVSFASSKYKGPLCSFSLFYFIVYVFLCRKDSFITHRAYCDALAEESARLMAANTDATKMTTSISPPLLNHPLFLPFSSWDSLPNPNPNFNTSPHQVRPENTLPSLLHPYFHHLPTTTSPYLSATALIQRASTMGATTTTTTTGSATISTATGGQMGSSMFDVGDPSAWQRSDGPTRDFLGAVAGETGEEELLSLTGALGMDLVTAAAASCERGDHTKHVAGWGDR